MLHLNFKKVLVSFVSRRNLVGKEDLTGRGGASQFFHTVTLVGPCPSQTQTQIPGAFPQYFKEKTGMEVNLQCLHFSRLLQHLQPLSLLKF